MLRDDAVSNPLPLPLTLLVVLLPGVYLLGRRLTDWLEGEPEVRAPLAGMAALSALLVAIATVGRLTHSFVYGLSVSTAGLGLLGIAWTVRRRRHGSESANSTPGSSKAMWWSGLLVSLPVAFLTLQGDFFDDYNLIGHRGLIAQFQNDTYPPRDQVYPEYLFRYHYGFNVVAAAFTGLFRLSVGAAIDAVVLLGFFASWCLAWRLGERLTRSRQGAWTALGGLVSGGAFFWFLGHSDWAQQGAVGIVVGGNRINFPVVMYFFQKPFALGFPLAIAVMLAASVPPPEGRWRSRALLLALLLAPLSLAEVVLFVTLAPSLAAQELAAQKRISALLPAAAALLLALPLGGVLFTPMPEEGAGLLRARFWLAEQAPAEVFQWYFLTTGVLLPLGLLGLLGLPRLKLFFLLLILGSFAVPLFFEIPRSWDIVKFSTVGQLAAGLAAGSLLARLAAASHRLKASAIALLLVLLVASPIGYLSYWIREIVRPTPEIGQLLAAQRQPYEVPDWSRLVDWLRRTAPRDGSIYCQNPLLLRQLLFAGLSTAGPSVVNPQFGVPEKRSARRQALLDELPADPRRWREEGVLWMVTGPGEPLSPVVETWSASGHARRKAAFGPWRLYRLASPESR